jgi:hypothetical protein
MNLMADIVIEIRDGVVAEVYSDRDDLQVVVVDWDSIESGEGDHGAGVVPCSSLREMDSETAGIVRHLSES